MAFVDIPNKEYVDGKVDNIVVLSPNEPDSDQSKIWVKTTDDQVEIPTMEDLSDLSDGIQEELNKKTIKTRIDYNGTNFILNGAVLNYKQLHDIHLENPDFAFVVYGDRAYLLSYVQDDVGQMRELRFQSVIAATDSSNLSNVKVSGIYVTSSDGINIASVRVTDVNSENKAYKAVEINDGNKNSDVWYPTVGAVVDYVNPIKEDFTNLDGRVTALENGGGSGYDDTKIRRELSTVKDTLDGYIYDDIGANKFDDEVVTGILSDATGDIIEDSNYITTANSIDVSNFKSGYACGYSATSSGTVANGSSRIVFYDDDGEYISGVKAAYSAEIPNGAKFVKFSWFVDDAYKKHMVADAYASSKSDCPVYEDYYIVPKKVIASESYVDSKVGQYVSTDYLAEKQPAYFEPLKSQNKYNIATELMGYRKDANDNLVQASNFRVSDYIDISDNTTGYIFAYVDTNMSETGAWSISFYDSAKKFISAERNTSVNLGAVQVVNRAVYARVCLQYNKNWLNHPVVVFGTEKIPWVEYYNKRIQLPLDLVDDAFPWTGKTWLSYGDSITAIGNGNPSTAWQQYVTDRLHFGTQIVRGIGGQTYKWGTNGGSVTFVNAETGEYVDRNDSYNKDNYAGSVPSGSVAIRGAFCSWDRISHMIPDSIKDEIDLIFLFGVNDGNSGKTGEMPTFVTGNTTDTEWATASENVFGGDFNINTLEGAIASTLLKLQTRCPNALIVVGTSWSGRGDASGVNYPDVKGVGIYEEGKIVNAVAEYFSFNVIDLYHTLQVNPWNRSTYVTDTIHPYNDAGKKALARAVISGLKTIYPRLA